jgi:hypothetical protein
MKITSLSFMSTCICLDGMPPADNRVVIDIPIYVSGGVFNVILVLAVGGIALSLAALTFNIVYRKTKY